MRDERSLNLERGCWNTEEGKESADTSAKWPHHQFGDVESDLGDNKTLTASCFRQWFFNN